ncbi:family 78 glycoside hydrolase catalytic domain [Paenibacillus sp. CN-4]|uniref:family 78 glycoside hydrolase catalytic domain n=1 Tax=Paenibacillus nanchangensis TaxID=3348343 RepID=UPI00397ABBAB
MDLAIHPEEWNACWITREPPGIWDRPELTAEVQLTLEQGAAGLLFAYTGADRHCGCMLDAEERSVILFRVEQGERQVAARVYLTELERLPAELHLRLVICPDDVELQVNGREVIRNSMKAGTGRIGFLTEADGTAVYRDFRLSGPDAGRMLASSRFYDPAAHPFSAGEIDGSGSGLRLTGHTVSLCGSPVPADSPLFRRTFELPEGAVSAHLSVYAIGWYELRVNGSKADDRVLAPANTPYGRRLLYDSYEISGLLDKGTNTLAVWLGNGYGPNYSRWGWKWNRDKAFILQLDIELTSGEQIRVVSDESWKTGPGPLLANDIYDGEVYDGRLVPDGWDQAGFSQEKNWQPAVLAEPPAGSLEANGQPPVRTWTPLEPVQTIRVDTRTEVYDFGQNLAGWVRLQVKGEPGSRIRLRYSELTDAEGRLDSWTNRNARAADLYILRGGQTETYEPRFTYHGFRYVEAEVTGTAVIEAIRAVPVHADVPETGIFRSSDDLLGRIQSNLRWSILNNLVSIPTDCCQRDERTPCLMDSAVVEEAAIHNFGMRQYYRKWLGDIEDSRTNPDWSGDLVTLPWHLYWYYGDGEVLLRHYGAMKDYVDFITGKWPDGIVTEGFGDWCAPNSDGWEHYFREVEIVNTSLYYRQAAILSQAAGVLGRETDRTYYAELADSVRSAFHRRFGRGGGLFGSGSQTAQLLPLAFGMAEPHEEQAVFDRLLAAIGALGNRLDTGIYGTRYLMDVLADHGQIDLAYAMITRKEYPGFGDQIAKGATTLWEQWSEKGAMHSHNHAMFGGIGASFYTRIGGIRPLEPGYRRFRIQPCIPRELEWAEVSMDTISGRIRSAWRKDGGRLELNVTVPPCTGAEIILPGNPRQKEKEDAGVISVGPGDHQFVV